MPLFKKKPTATALAPAAAPAAAAAADAPPPAIIKKTPAPRRSSFSRNKPKATAAAAPAAAPEAAAPPAASESAAKPAEPAEKNLGKAKPKAAALAPAPAAAVNSSSGGGGGSSGGGKALPAPTKLPPPARPGKTAPPSSTQKADDSDSDSDSSEAGGGGGVMEEEELDGPAKAVGGLPTPKKGQESGPQFKGAGEGPGVLIWRVENMAPAPVDKAEYGKFCSGDAYLLLKTVTTKSGGFEYDLFFWLGEKCSIDEQGAAAILARDLDDMLGGAPIQHRVVQGHEPPEFVAALGGTMSYLDGGVESGMRKVEAGNSHPTRLLHVKGLRQCRVGQVGLSVASMNAGDVFVVDTGSMLYQWNGREASVKEKQKGVEVCLGLKDERVHEVELLGEVRHVQLEQGQPSEDEFPEFWKLLGGGKAQVPAAIEDSKEDDKKAAKETELYRLKESEKNGKRVLTTEKMKAVSRSMLDPDDSFILVCPAEIYAWIGSKATDAERKNAMVKAQQFIRTANKPNWTLITRVIEGAEPQLFKSKFSDWQAGDASGKPSLEMYSLKKGISSGRNVAKNIKEDAPGDIARKVMVADPKRLQQMLKAEAEKKRKSLVPGSKGSGLAIWRIANFRMVPVEKELYGCFYAGDCYIVCFKCEVYGKEEVRLYHWHGRLASADEKGSAALLTRNMDDQEYGGNAVQERVVQNNEPEEFIAIFEGKLVVRDGGLTKTGVDTRDHDGVSLFQVKGQSALTVRAVQVVESATSLNSGDCFVLERPGHVHVWHGTQCSDDERKTSVTVGDVIAQRLAYQAGKSDLASDAAAAAAAAAAAVVGVDEDGDGIPDMAVPIVLACEAGGAMPGGAQAEKLGTYLPQAGTQGDRPYYAHESNPALMVWWAKERWWLGKRDELGRNRGWLKIKSTAFSPPASGWICYVTKEKSWKEATQMRCVEAERIVVGGATPDGAHTEKLGEFCKTAEVRNERPVFCRETRPSLMIWWAGGRWWLGKRDELGTTRGWIKVHSEEASPLKVRGGWMVYSPAAKKWKEGEQLWCKVNDEHVPKPEPPPKPDGGDVHVTQWEVSACAEGSEPSEFWGALGGKKPYADQAPVVAQHEPRLFYCSDQTGAFRVEEVFDFSQEDLEHDNVYILDCFERVYVWVGAENENAREIRLSLETAAAFIPQQAILDKRPTGQKPIEVRAGSEPLDFTKEFVGWSKSMTGKFEDPYEKKLRLERERKEREAEEAVETVADEPMATGDAGGDAAALALEPLPGAADAAWGKGNETVANRPASSIPVKNIIKLTMERNGGKAPPVAALRNGEIILRNAKQVQVPGAKVVVPALALGQIPQIHEASSLDSARRRANAAAKAAGGEAESYADPESERFCLKDIQEGNTPRKLNPMCKELYLADAEFIVTFGMDKDQFWKQPFWKQRDAKRKNNLF